MDFCEKCGESKFLVFGEPETDCQCQPFLIIDEEGEEHTLHAYDEHDAAMKYAERSNSNGDYYLMNNHVDIIVNGRSFRIGAEPDIHYTAIAL